MQWQTNRHLFPPSQTYLIKSTSVCSLEAMQVKAVNTKIIPHNKNLKGKSLGKIFPKHRKVPDDNYMLMISSNISKQAILTVACMLSLHYQFKLIFSYFSFLNIFSSISFFLLHWVLLKTLTFAPRLSLRITFPSSRVLIKLSKPCFDIHLDNGIRKIVLYQMYVCKHHTYSFRPALQDS